MMMSFRPLDGESFSKPSFIDLRAFVELRFRPLDGESFSKHLQIMELK